MLILGSWAGLNMITGGLGYARTQGSISYFHQMNAAWNIVNAGIAYFGFKGTLSNSNVTTSEILNDMTRFDTILLVNAGLDVLYISGGAWLLIAATNWVKNVGTGMVKLLFYKEASS